MIAKTMAGLEDVLAEELIGLGANNLEIGKRMVSFEGDLALMYKATYSAELLFVYFVLSMNLKQRRLMIYTRR